MKCDNTLDKKMSHATIPLNKNPSKNWRKVKPNVSDKAGLLPRVGVAIGIGIEKRIKNDPDADSDSELHGTSYRLRNRPSSSICRS